jgi:hypothetical protein
VEWQRTGGQGFFSNMLRGGFFFLYVEKGCEGFLFFYKFIGVRVGLIN